MLRDDGQKLSQCGTQWGKAVDVSGSGPIKLYVGKKSWIETTVEGVIGLNGNEPGNGPGIVIHDVEHAGIEMLWTSGLVGCMCIAVQGRDENGKLDVFFCHARKYDEKNAVENPDNPMKLARDFVVTHKDIRVFWGTDFNFSQEMGVGPDKKAEAQKLLSKELGCWVRNSDCIVNSELVFFPSLGIMKYGSPKEVYKWIGSQDLTSKIEFSKSKVLSIFQPDPVILTALKDHLAALQKDRSAWIRFYFHDSRRTNKISVLEQIIDAYNVGNLDVLRYFSGYASNKTSPYRDAAASNMWDAMSESVTASLVIEAYHDALKKILEMGDNGCGLRANGDFIHDDKEYMQIVRLSGAGPKV